MRYFFLVWAGLWRKPTRTLLTSLSIAVTFLIYASLTSVLAGIDTLIDNLGTSRLRVQSRAGALDPLPLGYSSQIERIEGVASVVPMMLVQSYYQEKRKRVDAIAVQPERVFDFLLPQISVRKEYVDAMKRTRVGAIIGEGLAKKYGWRIGDRVPLNFTRWVKGDGSSDWTFEIVGIYQVQGAVEFSEQFWFDYAYLDESRVLKKGTVETFVVNLSNHGDSGSVSAAIDDHFANATRPTITKPEQEWVRSSLERVGDLNLIVQSIVGAALFALLFLTGTTMVQSVRERLPELAILKAIGYSNNSLFTMVVIEGMILSAIGLLVGLALGRGISPFITSIFHIAPMGGVVVRNSALLALALAMLASALPAWRAKRLSIVETLTRR